MPCIWVRMAMAGMLCCSLFSSLAYASVGALSCPPTATWQACLGLGAEARLQAMLKLEQRAIWLLAEEQAEMERAKALQILRSPS